LLQTLKASDIKSIFKYILDAKNFIILFQYK
jgi:hypothetical protein